jgi:hypothetical protein
LLCAARAVGLHHEESGHDDGGAGIRRESDAQEEYISLDKGIYSEIDSLELKNSLYDW